MVAGGIIRVGTEFAGGVVVKGATGGSSKMRVSSLRWHSSGSAVRVAWTLQAA